MADMQTSSSMAQPGGHLTRWLSTSVLLRPWVSLAGLPAPLAAHPVSEVAYPDAVFNALLTIGLTGWLLSLVVVDTGPIGLFTWAMLPLTLLAAWRQRRWPRWNGVDALVGLFFASAVVSAAFSSIQPTSWEGLLKFGTFLAGYLTFRLLPERLRQGWIPLCLGIIACGEAAIGFYQYINHIQPLATWEDPSVNPELRLTRIFGTLKPNNPNLLAGFLIPPVASTGALALRWLTQRHWLKAALLGILPVGILLAALVMTGSRGGFLAIATMGLTGFLLVGHLIWQSPTWPDRSRWRQAWLLSLLLAVAGVAGVLLVSPALQHRVLSIFAMRDDSSNAFRLNVYHSAWQMFLDNMGLGIGPGNGTFKLVYGLYMVPGYSALSAYSVPLEIAVEQGLPGLLIFVSLLVVCKLRVWLCVDHPGFKLGHKLLLAGALVGITGSLTYGLFDTIWYRPSVNLLFWWLVAVCASA